jgi:hypothetical protein
MPSVKVDKFGFDAATPLKNESQYGCSQCTVCGTSRGRTLAVFELQPYEMILKELALVTREDHPVLMDSQLSRLA